jgi:hypothetical protein
VNLRWKLHKPGVVSTFFDRTLQDTRGSFHFLLFGSNQNAELGFKEYRWQPRPQIWKECLETVQLVLREAARYTSSGEGRTHRLARDSVKVVPCGMETRGAEDQDLACPTKIKMNRSFFNWNSTKTTGVQYRKYLPHFSRGNSFPHSFAVEMTVDW